MPCVSYISNGLCKTGIKLGDYHGLSELRFFNPTSMTTHVTMTVYYADRPPVVLPSLSIQGKGNPLLVFPYADYSEKDFHEYFSECGPWGMKIISDTPLIIDHILLAGRQGPPNVVQYSGGVNDSLAQPRLSKLWYFGDGIRIIYPSQDTASFPFDEFEWYHILNPNQRTTQVKMTCTVGNGDEKVFMFTVEGERVLFIDNFDMFTKFTIYPIVFESDQPVLVESERLIYGVGSLEKWGAHIHCPRPGLPAPLLWNEEGA